MASHASSCGGRRLAAATRSVCWPACVECRVDDRRSLVWLRRPALEDRTFAGKRESLLALRELPKLSGKPSAIATDLKREWGDYDEFIDAGWEFLLRGSLPRCSFLSRFPASSRGEIGIAKAGYVVSQGGWISDRSLVYLALGRPVVLQDTGWKHAVDFSKGMVPFQEVEDCATAIRDIEADYERHSKAARELAETLFSSKGTLAPMLSRIL